ncbi:hypothetical protein L484_004011 [Morus notabilis]|uniref:Uncharacterized protein n=1 Tax=Morus notabilis TaxID=981085 RepID=W9QNC9_9ROSA|nr:hypothetical protein L484_004011 [Morus notabilis]
MDSMETLHPPSYPRTEHREILSAAAEWRLPYSSSQIKYCRYPVTSGALLMLVKRGGDHLQ